MALDREHTERIVEPVRVEAIEAAAAGRKRPARLLVAVAAVLLVAGVGVAAYPTVSDWWNDYRQSAAISAYEDAVSEIDAEQAEALLADARAYNERLLANANRYEMTDEEKAEYAALLDPAGSGVMGHVHVGVINVSYPIYHGMDETILQGAIGHLEGTSLPVGGKGTHTAISGHRGLPSARLFSDLDKLAEGDTFTITVLGQTLTYEIDQIHIVLPTDLADLAIDPDKDLATLVTCTPYGINSHRLLVRGHRVEGAGEDALAAEAVQVPLTTAIPAVAAPMLVVFLVVLGACVRRRSKGFDKEAVATAIRDEVLKPHDGGEG